jgi:hypothetical protein
MHHKFLVTTNATSSFDARLAVLSGLIRQGFLKDPTERWGGGIADWFQIGGRYSGLLSGIGEAAQLRRNRDDQLGDEDDAQLVTAELYDRYLAEYEGRAEGDGFADIEREPVSRAFIGSKWLVVVDYHY